MLEYDRIYISEGIDADKTNRSKECMFCHFLYFFDKIFRYGPYLCDGCYNMTQKSTDFENIAIVNVKKSSYRIYFPYMNKHEAKKLMNKLDLIDKMGSIMNCND